MKLIRLSFSVAGLLWAAALGVPAAWGQSSTPVPIVTPTQVVAKIHSPNGTAPEQEVERPQPIPLEACDFSTDFAAAPGRENSAGFTVGPTEGNEQYSREAALPQVHRADNVATSMPAVGPVQQTGFLSAAGRPTVPAAGRVAAAFSANQPQDIAPSPVPAPPVADGGSELLPTILPTAPDVIQPQVQGFAGDPHVCSFCGGAGCEHCSGGETPYDLEAVSSQFQCCGFVSSARYYAIVDYLRWDYENTRVVSGNLSGVDGYDPSHGWRIILGRRWDANSGLELTYFGLVPWEAETLATSAGGNLTAGFVPVGGLPPASLSAFSNATSLLQTDRARFQAFDIMDTLWGWDVVKTSWGFRYLYFNEELELATTNNVGQTGNYDLELTNFMFGPQLGMEMFYDIGYRLSFSMSTKVAGFLNFNRGDTLLANNGSTVIDATDRDTSWAASGDVGFYAHYQLLPGVRARVGYDVVALWQMATVAENYSPFIGPFTGTEYSNDDEVFFQGASAGIEIYR